MTEWVHRVWYGSPINVHVSEDNLSRFDQWVWNMIGKNGWVTDYQKAILASVCWMIWKMRCNAVFQDQNIDPTRVLNDAVDLVDDYWRANGWMGEGFVKQKCKVQKGWELPLVDTVKVNVDGSYQYKTGSVGIGVVYRDDSGVVIGGFAGQISSSSAFYVRGYGF